MAKVQALGRSQVLSYLILFGLGALAGLLIDRLLTGQLNSAAFAYSALGAALIPIGGVALQLYFANESRERTDLRARKEAHAAKLAQEVLLPLSRLGFVGSVGYVGEQGRSLPIGVEYADHQTRHVEGLAFWDFAAAHFPSNPLIHGPWLDIRKAAQTWRASMLALDMETYTAVSSAVRDSLGQGFVTGSDWDDPPLDRWFNVERFSQLLRMDATGLKFASSTVPYREVAGRAATSREVVTSGAFTLLGSIDKGQLTEQKAETIYKRLFTDANLIRIGAHAREAEKELKARLPRFREAAWRFYQKVEASQHLDGSCEICADFG